MLEFPTNSKTFSNPSECGTNSFIYFGFVTRIQWQGNVYIGKYPFFSSKRCIGTIFFSRFFCRYKCHSFVILNQLSIDCHSCQNILLFWNHATTKQISIQGTNFRETKLAYIWMTDTKFASSNFTPPKSWPFDWRKNTHK